MCKHSFHQRCLDTVAANTTSNKSNITKNGRKFQGQRRNRNRRDPRRLDDNDNEDSHNSGNEEDKDEEEEGQGLGLEGNNSDDDDDDDDDDTNDIECPVCAPQNATVRAIRRAQAESAHRHDMFLDVLGRGKDGFGTVSEWFGRGVMNN